MVQNVLVTGMVLNAMPIGEYDKRITLLTKERGKLVAFARGARRANSQLLAATDSFAFGEFTLFEGRSSYTIAKASIQHYFREIGMDVDATYYGFYFLEFADYYCQENNDEREMLKLLYQSLRALISPSYDNRLVRAIFELKAMAINGVGPNVFSCHCCGQKETLSYFSVKMGGVLCGGCKDKSPDPVLVDAATLYAMQYILYSKIEKLYTFTVSAKVLAELEREMKRYLKYYIGHTFKALKILEEADHFSG
ncbi:MAG: DNA repair protein RecO [Clostridiales bacterium]|nr:DNA repair protein RecO [Clostridiales bacterium]